MTKPIASIIWPTEAQSSVRLFLLFMLKAVECLGITFATSNHDPIAIVKEHLAGNDVERQRQAALSYWWTIVDDQGIRNFEGEGALIARLAICLLTPNEADVQNFGEQLSWFLEVLEFLQFDTNEVMNLMANHFSYT